MSGYQTYTDYASFMRGLLRLADQDATNIKAIYDAFAEQLYNAVTGEGVENVEAELVDAFQLVDPGGATGLALDNLGAIVGQPRLGANDARYRQLIAAKIVNYRSGGQPDQILTVVSIITQAAFGNVRIVFYYPAACIVAVIAPVNYPEPGWQKLLESIAPAGVLIQGSVAPTLPYFGFLGNPEAAGFGVGHFAEIVI